MSKTNNMTTIPPKWKDRKRFLGIPCTFTKYTIENDRLYINTGLLKTEMNEVLLYRILDIKSSQKLFQKIFRVGNITLYCADQNNRTLELKNIKHPVQTHRLISSLVEDERRERNVIGREIAGAASFDMDHMDGYCNTGHDEV